MRSLQLTIGLLCGMQLCAQYNSDCKTVQKKHIKAAIAYNVQNDGDTEFVRYNYDREGRLLSIGNYLWNEHCTSQWFDEHGYEAGYLELSPAGRADTMLERDEYLKIIGNKIDYDTMSYWTGRYNDAGEMIYMYTCGNDGGYNANWWWISGDTTYSFYSIERGVVIADELDLKIKIDSVPNGYAQINYAIQGTDTTIISCSVTVLDKRNNPIRSYYVAGLRRNPPPIKPRGSSYPVGDSTIQLILGASYVNEYRSNGELKRVTTMFYPSGEIRTVDYPKSTENEIQSLEDIKHFGTVIYEYYEP